MKLRLGYTMSTGSPIGRVEILLDTPDKLLLAKNLNEVGGQEHCLAFWRHIAANEQNQGVIAAAEWWLKILIPPPTASEEDRLP